MFFIYGQKTAMIKHSPDHQQACKSCRDFNMHVSVFRNYFHIWFLPFFPTSRKQTQIQCRSCGEYDHSEEAIREHAKAAKTPIWFYTLTILIGAFVIYMIYQGNEDDKKNIAYVSNPAAGDVYTVKSEHDNKTFWFFLKVMDVKGDSVITCHSYFEYNQRVTDLQKDDYFVLDDKLLFTKAELKRLLDNSDIDKVYRNYGSYRFDRVK